MDTKPKTFYELPWINSVGVSLFDPIWAQKVHRPCFSEILYILEGSMDLIVRRNRYPGQSGDVLLVPLEAPHRDVFPVGTDIKILMVNFVWPCARWYFQRLPSDAARRLTTSGRMELVRLLMALHAEHRETAANSALSRARLYQILMLLYDAWFPTRRTKGEDDCGARRRRALMLRARAYLERHYAEPLSLETIAQALRVSPYYLSHVFSAENEFSLSQYLISWRMEKAHELLVKGTHNVTEAARAVGYQDGDYFAKAFMRHFGRPPRAVRE